MANPYGNIAGVSAQSEPGWQERLLAMVAENEQNSRRRKAGIRTGRINIACDEEFVAIIAAAARSRGLNTTAYVRRAAAAFAAADLGVNIDEILQFAPKATPFGDSQQRKEFTAEPTRDTEEGFGSWEVKV